MMSYFFNDLAKYIKSEYPSAVFKSPKITIIKGFGGIDCEK